MYILRCNAPDYKGLQRKPAILVFVLYVNRHRLLLKMENCHTARSCILLGDTAKNKVDDLSLIRSEE